VSERERARAREQERDHAGERGRGRERERGSEGERDRPKSLSARLPPCIRREAAPSTHRATEEATTQDSKRRADASPDATTPFSAFVVFIFILCIQKKKMPSLDCPRHALRHAKMSKETYYRGQRDLV
jgi:hypothetical protein